MDAIITAVHDLLTANSADLRAVVAGLDREALNRAPVDGANSIAVLVAHAATATAHLIDSAISGRANRERYLAEVRTPAFATHDADAAQLLALVDRLDGAIARLAAVEDGIDYGGAVAAEGGTPGEPRTRAWSLVHAVEHLREHIGHAQLTRQLIEAGQPVV
jgi:hypothetical protein